MFGKILIIDDDPSVLETLELLLSQETDKTDTLKNPNLILKKLQSETYDIILLDMNFSAGINTGNEGLFWLKKILTHDPDAVVVMITAFGNVQTAVEAMKAGATDFIEKPWNNDLLNATLKNAWQIRQSKLKIKSLEHKNQSLSSEIKRHYPEIIGRSDAILQVRNTIKKIAKTDTNVLILGENGTGKELVAREIHHQSKRSDEVFMSVDMSSLAETLFESELFGHVKGAFTDAKTDRTGKFVAASGGTLFLDEIGNLSISMQSKILTALQNREVTPIGTNQPTPIDIRLLSATNKDPIELISNNLFREDLYYRINTVQIKVPPLHDRDQDTLLLTEHFLNIYTRKYDRAGLKISNRAITKLVEYNWPGNIRELQHAIESAVIFSESGIIQPDDLLMRQKVQEPSRGESLLLSDVEKATIARAIDKYKGNYTTAATELGISRTTLYLKIKKYDL